MNKSINESMVEWSVIPEIEHMHPDDCFALDVETQKEVVDSIIQDSQWNEWAWCCVCVKASFGGIEAKTYLGACSYESRKQFEQSGDYEYMKQEVLNELNNKARNLIQTLIA
jgi:hypothetical protein